MRTVSRNIKNAIRFALGSEDASLVTLTPNAKRQTPNGERRTVNGERLTPLESGSSSAKMRLETADSSHGFIRIVSLTAMVLVPRYRLAVGRMPKNLRSETSSARFPVQQWTEANIRKTKAILNV
jgi:hypothetical protein